MGEVLPIPCGLPLRFAAGFASGELLPEKLAQLLDGEREPGKFKKST